MKVNTSFLLHRRTIRKYKNEDVADDLLNDIINEGCRTSTTGNMQVYSIIVTRDRQIRQQLLPLHFNQPMVTGSPGCPYFLRRFQQV